MKEKIKNVKGITLIALVVTIIILLILAGVAINVAIGDNGLFKKSKQAVEKYKDAEANEIEVLDDLVHNIISLQEPKVVGTTTSDVISKITEIETENIKVRIGGEDVIIPAGFKISSESAETVSGGIVVVDNTENHNEWVWVPCYVTGGVNETETIANGYPEFKRYDFEKYWNTTSWSDYSEKMPKEQYNSVKNYGGFYIARYEAGDKETTALGLLRGEEGSNITVNTGDTANTVVIKYNQTPYTYVTQIQCVELSNNFATNNGYDLSKMFTTLCSSYAWDSALKFIEKTNIGYATNSPQGNYSGGLKNTGLSTAVCNIYDMGGNLWEYTTEKYGASGIGCAGRGAFYTYTANNGPAGFRSAGDNNVVFEERGFRPTLFLK